MYNAYDGKQRFYDEIGKRTREVKESLCDIQSKYNSNEKIISDILEQIKLINPSASSLYNINEQFIISDTNTLNFPADTYHSISYIVLSGTANITEGGTTLSSAPQGYSGESEATTLLTNELVITGLSNGTKVVIKTIK